jgi:pyrroloquinoline quinone biosynthesis protein D
MSGPSPVPRFRRGVKFRFDETRQAWILLAPEKLLLPEGTAVEILRRVDGTRAGDEIVDDLAAMFNAPRAVIAADVETLLRDLEAKGILSL